MGKLSELLSPLQSRVVTLRFGDHVLRVQQLSPDELKAAWSNMPGSPARNAIAEHYLPLVYHFAERKAATLPHGASVDLSDLFSAGWEGLAQCIDRFDRARNLKFETYAPMRINGAMQDAIRGMDHVPRIERARERQGTAQTRAVVSLSEVGVGRNVEEAPDWRKTLESQLPDKSACDDFRRIDDRHSLQTVLHGLSKPERIVLLMYYWQGCKMSQVAKCLGVSESRASQIHNDLLRRYRNGELGGRWQRELLVGA